MSTVVQIQLRRDTSTNWSTVNPVLKSGEPGYETNTGKLKFGDGVTAWNGLPYFETDKHFVFIQSTAATTWTINHNLNKHPSVAVVDSAGSFVYGAETHIDNNNLIIEFSAPFKGRAYLN